MTIAPQIQWLNRFVDRPTISHYLPEFLILYQNYISQLKTLDKVSIQIQVIQFTKF